MESGVDGNPDLQSMDASGLLLLHLSLASLTQPGKVEGQTLGAGIEGRDSRKMRWMEHESVWWDGGGEVSGCGCQKREMVQKEH